MAFFDTPVMMGEALVGIVASNAVLLVTMLAFVVHLDKRIKRLEARQP
jgi:hypothetical protein